MNVLQRTQGIGVRPREELLGRGLVVREVNWLGSRQRQTTDRGPQTADHGSTVHVQIRHRAAAARAEILRDDGDEIELALDEPLAAITPGQSAVLYDGDRVLGGGVIESAAPAAAREAAPRTALPILAA